eukprot:5694017-Pleurochrysis_carterae.AAC.2
MAVTAAMAAVMAAMAAAAMAMPLHRLHSPERRRTPTRCAHRVSTVETTSNRSFVKRAATEGYLQGQQLVRRAQDYLQRGRKKVEPKSTGSTAIAACLKAQASRMRVHVCQDRFERWPA